MFYTIMLTLHNLWRWVVVLTVAWALLRAWSGWLGKRPWTKTDHQAGMFFTISLDVQLLGGLILAHIGSAVARKGTDDAAKHRRAAIWYTLTILAIVLAIPWSRPLFRI